MSTTSSVPVLSPDNAPCADGWELAKLPRKPRPRATAGHYQVIDHRPLGDRYMALTLHAPAIAESAQPGQFLMLTAARKGEATPALPRPMAIYSTDDDSGNIEVFYGVVGSGTERLKSFRVSEEMFVVGPLGRAFEIEENVQRVLLIGRGIGTCSLTTVAQHNAKRNLQITAVTSARDSTALIGADFYRDNGAKVYEVTDVEGTSTPEALFATLTSDLDSNPPQVIMTCGSERLTKLCEALASRWDAKIQVSVEAHMACGLGYCHGCASGARSEGDESPLICNDGPVFSWTPVSPELQVP
ncbi:iron-sulfur cluster-binding protein [Glutamicibacter ardleyensis]|uniref:iron-sulfur cluster-binding protein n=1 Tax=Glutamicibacter ardleyensis TaxID=225894 RepID=UPI003FB9F19E